MFLLFSLPSLFPAQQIISELSLKQTRRTVFLKPTSTRTLTFKSSIVFNVDWWEEGEESLLNSFQSLVARTRRVHPVATFGTLRQHLLVALLQAASMNHEWGRRSNAMPRETARANIIRSIHHRSGGSVDCGLHNAVAVTDHRSALRLPSLLCRYRASKQRGGRKGREGDNLFVDGRNIGIQGRWRNV